MIFWCPRPSYLLAENANTTMPYAFWSTTWATMIPQFHIVYEVAQAQLAQLHLNDHLLRNNAAFLTLFSMSCSLLKTSAIVSSRLERSWSGLAAGSRLTTYSVLSLMTGLSTLSQAS